MWFCSELNNWKIILVPTPGGRCPRCGDAAPLVYACILCMHLYCLLKQTMRATHRSDPRLEVDLRPTFLWILAVSEICIAYYLLKLHTVY